MATTPYDEFTLRTTPSGTQLTHVSRGQQFGPFEVFTVLRNPSISSPLAPLALHIGVKATDPETHHTFGFLITITRNDSDQYSLTSSPHEIGEGS